MADFSQSKWLSNVLTHRRIDSARALHYQRASKTKGLAKFLISPECNHYLALGLKFIGVEYNCRNPEVTDPVFWFVKNGVQDLAKEKLPINNLNGDWALFSH